jgi:hypothetical protein
VARALACAGAVVEVRREMASRSVTSMDALLDRIRRGRRDDLWPCVRGSAAAADEAGIRATALDYMGEEDRAG